LLQVKQFRIGDLDSRQQIPEIECISGKVIRELSVPVPNNLLTFFRPVSYSVHILNFEWCLKANMSIKNNNWTLSFQHTVCGFRVAGKVQFQTVYLSNIEILSISAH